MQTYELLVTLRGPLLVGGYTDPRSYVDATTAVDAQGNPYIPASTLRGVLREACWRAAHAFEASVCHPLSPCGVCIVCQLFGSPGTDSDDVVKGSEVTPGRGGRLFISDAEAPVDQRSRLRERIRVSHGVGIDRSTRAVASGLLFQREVLDAPGATFVARLTRYGADDDAWNHLELSLPLATSLGGGQSRGLGRVDVALRPVFANVSSVHRVAGPVPDSGALLVRVTTEEPFLVGGMPTSTGLRETEPVIPGSALRGAIATALDGVLAPDDMAAVFADPERCVLFSDALPAPPHAGDLPVPVPLSSLVCKYREDRRHRRDPREPQDGLFEAALLPHLIDKCGWDYVPPLCPVCGEPLRPAKGGTFRARESARQVVTRLARDPCLRSAAPGMLYSYEQGTRESTFVAVAARMDDRALRVLDTLVGREVRVGRGRSRGLGRVSLAIEPASCLQSSDLEARLVDMNHEQERHLPLLRQAHGERLTGALAVLARTDLGVPPESAPETLRQAIFGAAPARTLAVVQASRLRSGWNDGRNGAPPGPRPLLPVVRAGSAWLFGFEGPDSLDRDRLLRLEVEGLGQFRELGLGRLHFNHSLFTYLRAPSRGGNR